VSAADVQREGEHRERASKERRLKPGDVQMTNVGYCDLTKKWLVIDACSFKDRSTAATGIKDVARCILNGFNTDDSRIHCKRRFG
jgi:hypothetical protein